MQRPGLFQEQRFEAFRDGVIVIALSFLLPIRTRSTERERIENT